jgi:hypothetical protein
MNNQNENEKRKRKSKNGAADHNAGGIEGGD